MTKAERANRRAIAAQLRAQHGAHAKTPCKLCLVLELLEEQEGRLDAVRDRARAITNDASLGRVEAYEAAEALVEELARS